MSRIIIDNKKLSVKTSSKISIYDSLFDKYNFFKNNFYNEIKKNVRITKIIDSNFEILNVVTKNNKQSVYVAKKDIDPDFKIAQARTIHSLKRRFETGFFLTYKKDYNQICHYPLFHNNYDYMYLDLNVISVKQKNLLEKIK